MQRALANVDQARDDVEAMPAGDHGTLSHIVEAIGRRCRAIIASLDDDTGLNQPHEEPTTSA